MTNAIHDFATLAVNALVDIVDPAALQTAADEALASLEQSVPSLPSTHRAHGRLIARCLYEMHSGVRPASCATEEALGWLRKALLLARDDTAATGLLYAGKDLERASSVVDWMPPEHRPLAELLRCCVGAVERAAIELAVVQQHGGRRVAA